MRQGSLTIADAFAVAVFMAMRRRDRGGVNADRRGDRVDFPKALMNELAVRCASRVLNRRVMGDLENRCRGQNQRERER